MFHDPVLASCLHYTFIYTAVQHESMVFTEISIRTLILIFHHWPDLLNISSIQTLKENQMEIIVGLIAVVIIATLVHYHFAAKKAPTSFTVVETAPVAPVVEATPAVVEAPAKKAATKKPAAKKATATKAKPAAKKPAAPKKAAPAKKPATAKKPAKK